MPRCILDVNGLEGALVLLPVLDHSDSAPVPSARDDHDIAYVELDEVDYLVGLEVKLYGVVALDERVGVADRSSVVGVEVWNAFLSELDGTHLAELELYK